MTFYLFVAKTHSHIYIHNEFKFIPNSLNIWKQASERNEKKKMKTLNEHVEYIEFKWNCIEIALKKKSLRTIHAMPHIHSLYNSFAHENAFISFVFAMVASIYHYFFSTSPESRARKVCTIKYAQNCFKIRRIRMGNFSTHFVAHQRSSSMFTAVTLNRSEMSSDDLNWIWYIDKDLLKTEIRWRCMWNTKKQNNIYLYVSRIDQKAHFAFDLHRLWQLDDACMRAPVYFAVAVVG